ncbi:TPA: terminase small subunit, partial [Bacillus cereus]|nr:terminase small subunit [Bacillus cereus]
KSVQKAPKNDQNKGQNEPQDELAAHRKKWRKSQ